MDYFKAILIFFISSVCFSSEFDPNTYQVYYSDSSPFIYDMSYIELKYYENELLNEVDNLVLDSRVSIGLSEGQFADPNDLIFTEEMVVAFEFNVLLTRVMFLILDMEYDKSDIIYQSEYDRINQFSFKIFIESIGYMEK